MAHVQKLSDSALETIAKQVGKLYPSLDNSVARLQYPAELTETFPVWFLLTDAIATGNSNLLELAQDTHRWHSQIRIAGKPEGVARSISTGEDASDWSVKQIIKGDLAKAVDDAIQWIDAEVKSESVVCILEIPEFFITSLWLIDDEQKSTVVIAKLPEDLQNLSRLVQYSSQDFLEVLRQERHAIGIRDKRAQLSHHHEQSASKRNTFNVLSIN